ncbi:Uncharacterised protein [Serratia marcescens]|nr:Uncharacterised protein [Serratia marcescens]
MQAVVIQFGIDQQCAVVLIVVVGHQMHRRIGAHRRVIQHHFHQAALLHRTDVVDLGFQRRAAVEDIDVALIAQAFRLQQSARRQGLRMHFADHFLRVFGQEIDIQRVFRHQFGDKRLLPGAAQVVRLGELDGEEMAPDALPERRSAVFIGETAHLGDQAPGETFAERGNKQETHLRQQLAVLAVTIIRIEEQRAQLRMAGMIVAEEQRRHRFIDVQLFGSVHLRADAEAVPGFRQADGHFDRADPDHLTALAVFQHEQITLVTLRKFALPGF